MIQFGLGEFYALACTVAWAAAVILFKKSGESLAPFALNFFKNLSVVPLFLLTLLALHGFSWPSLPLADVPLILASGVLGIAVGDTLYFRALNALGASRMAVVQTLYSPGVILLSILFLGERLNLLQFAGVALVLGGILLVTYVRHASAADARSLRRGVLLGGASVFVMAAGVVIAKPMLEQHDFVSVTFLRILGAIAAMVVIQQWQSPWSELWAQYRAVRHWPQVWAGSILGTYVSMMLWLAGYKYTSASIAAVLNEMAAVVILLMAVVFLRERVTPRQVAGVLLAIAGVFLVVLR